MYNFINLVQSRFDDAFIALLAMVLLQLFFIFLDRLVGKSLSPMPLMERALRHSIIELIDKLNRNDRTPFALIFRGFIIVTIIAVFLYTFIWSINLLCNTLSLTLYQDIILLGFIISPILLIPLCLEISFDDKKKPEGAFKHLAQSLQENLVLADNHGLRRKTARLISIALIDWVIAPLTFFILTGIYGAYAYFGLSLIVKSIPNKQTRFSLFPCMLLRWAEIMMTLLGLVLMAVSTIFAPATKIGATLKGLKHKDNMIESGLAYTHGIVLGGPVHNRHGETLSLPWVGAGSSSAKLQHKDTLRMTIHYGVTLCIILVILYILTLSAD